MSLRRAIGARLDYLERASVEANRRVDSLNEKIDVALRTARRGNDLARQFHQECFNVLDEHERRLQEAEKRIGTIDPRKDSP